MNIEKTITKGTKLLKNSNIKNPYLDSELLLSEVIKKDRKYMILKTHNSGVLLLHLKFNMMEFLQTGQRIGWRLKVICTMAIWQTTLTPNCTKILKRSTPALGYTNRETSLAGSI